MNSANFLKFGFSVLLIVVNLPVLGQRNDKPRSLPNTADLEKISADNIRLHVEVLASDRFEGRAPGTRGESLTVDYLVTQFKNAGLKPGNPDGSYLQKVPLTGYKTVPQIDIEAEGKTFPIKFLDDFVHDFPTLRPEASIKNAGVVFAGYGISAPQYGWDDYKNVDVLNKLVIVMSGEPSEPDKIDPKKLDPSVFKGGTRTYYSTREFKFDLAAKKGAAGILVITDPSKANTFSLFKTFAKMEGMAITPRGPGSSTLISGLITADAARRIIVEGGNEFEKLQESAGRRDFKAVGLKARAGISVKSKLRNIVSANVVARVEGSDPGLKNEFVVYSAHWDHLGKDTSLAGDQIYNGAVDDGIGLAQMLEIARGFAKLKKKPRRSILFIATTSEEKGYLGSRYYTQNPLYPIAKAIANFNLDAGNPWGRTKDIMSASYGFSTLDEVLERAAATQGRTFAKESLDDGGLYFASDQIEFAKAGIPAVFPFSGFEYLGKPKDFGEVQWQNYSDNHYHKVTDEVKPDWDLSGAGEDAEWMMIAGHDVAQAEKRPAWKPGSEFEYLRRELAEEPMKARTVKTQVRQKPYREIVIAGRE